MIDFNIPLAGMSQAVADLNQTASHISKIGSPADSDGVDSVDLSTEVINLLQAQRDFQANANVVRTEAEVMYSSLE